MQDDVARSTGARRGGAIASCGFLRKPNPSSITVGGVGVGGSETGRAPSLRDSSVRPTVFTYPEAAAVRREAEEDWGK